MLDNYYFKHTKFVGEFYIAVPWNIHKYLTVVNGAQRGVSRVASEFLSYALFGSIGARERET